MVLDKITETIAHFVGLFDVAVEDVRVREQYRTFEQAAPAREEHAPLDPRGVTIRAPHEFDGFDPHIPYTPAEPPPVSAWTALDLVDRRLDAEFGPASGLEHFGSHRAFGTDLSLPFSSVRLPTLQPPASVAAIIEQTSIMADDDTVSYGGHGLSFQSRFDASAALEALAAQADALSLGFDAPMPGTPEAMKDFIVSLRDMLDAYEAQGHAEAGIAIAKGATLDGIYVNGRQVVEAPDFRDYRPQDDGEDDDDIFTDTFTDGWRAIAPDRELGAARADDDDGQATTGHTAHGQSSVELQAGGNTLVNSVVLNSSWLAASVTAIVGDHVELNAIVQVNVWSDVDRITSALGPSAIDGAETLAFNIASFERIDPVADAHGSAVAGDFPNFWVVTQVTGDLLILNWIEQMTFMSDNDIAILSATGAKAEIITGENGARNAVSLLELGHSYDLIVIGGSVYDASIIYQMNVLLDDDLVGATAGFAGTGANALTSSGNLLWNEAGIVNVGAADRFEPLTQPYRDAAARLAEGDHSAPAGVFSDPAFAGSGPLRVLYITGDVINLNFVKQVNILGDADQVALAMDAATTVPNAEWTVSTGANTLVNFAQIADVDALGKTYAGGGTYSDEILIQAELVSAAPAHGSSSADALVNEAIAFLGDDFLSASTTPDAPTHLIMPSADIVSADPMQTMLA